ncbi:hypothetical protein D3C72_1244140 [compost metagenome]
MLSTAAAASLSAPPSLAAPCCSGNGRLTPKQVPLPSWLSTRIRPCMASASSRQIARPRPLPPYCAAVRAPSACSKRRNNRCCCSWLMPGPVSRTSKCNPRGPSSQRACSVMLPRLVNLTALDSRLSRICRTRIASPVACIPAGNWLSRMNRRPFCAASGPINAARSCSRRLRPNALDCSSRRPDSIRARSSASLTRCSRCSPACRIDWV